MNKAIGHSSSALQPQHHQDGHDDPDPGRAADGPGPVALVGDPAMPREDRQPEDRDEGEPDREPDQRSPDEAGARVDERVARVEHGPDEQPHDGGGGEEPEIGQPVARLHRARV